MAIRAYLTSILFISTSLFMLCLATAAYTLFYWSYVPKMAFTRQIHLQFDDTLADAPSYHVPPIIAGAALTASPTVFIPPQPTTLLPHPHPWGTAHLSNLLVSQQPYDITIHLTLPRTATNTAQGNFMLDVSLLGSSTSGSTNPSPSSPLEPSQPLVAHSRRAAIMTYYSREIDLARKIFWGPVYAAGITKEVETLSIPVFEGVSFPRGLKSTPSTLKVQVQSRERLQVYACHAEIRAKFAGYSLRWFMYHHRVLAACVFISAFWGVEVVAMGFMWAVLAWIVLPGIDKTAVKSEVAASSDKRIKDEGDDHAKAYMTASVLEEDQARLSDTERIFPSYGQQPTLRYTSPTETEDIKIKKEDRDSVEPFPPLLHQGPGEAADDEEDEDEDVDFLLDSGLGTSMESSAGVGQGRTSGGVRRRKSGRMRVVRGGVD